MELDEIKKIWNEIDLLKEKQQVNENKIKEMLKNKGKNSITKLIGITKFSTYAAIPIGLIFCLASYQFFKAGGYYTIYPLILLLISILLVPGGVWAYRFLKKMEIDYSTMTVKEVAEKILKYQDMQIGVKYVQIGFFIYMGVFFYLSYRINLGSKIVWWFIIYLVVVHLAINLILIPFINKKLYRNHLNRIEESLKELEEFENS